MKAARPLSIAIAWLAVLAPPWGALYGQSTGVAATLQTARGPREVVLLSNVDGVVRYNLPGGGAVGALRVGEIERCRINVEYDRGKLLEATSKRQWSAAAAILVRPLLPLLPFLELAGNNQTPRAMEALTYLMRAADERALIGNAAAREEAVKQYRVGLALARAIAKADWFAGADEAGYRAVLCLIGVGELAEARQRLEDLAAPGEMEAAFGYYALARAKLLIGEGKWAEALEAGVESVVFQTKDIDCFPAALAATAACYEELGEWHRARDVYYAIGRLLKHTAWEIHAMRRLKHIFDQELTAAEEPRELRQVFFSGREDLNAIVKDLLDQFVKQQQQGKVGND